MAFNIHIFYHIFLPSEYSLFTVAEQLSLLQSSELLSNCKSLKIGLISSKNNNRINNYCYDLIESYNIDKNIEIMFHYETGDESNTAEKIKSHCDTMSSTNNEYMLYFHTKGNSHYNTEKFLPTKYWRHYMEYFNISKWKNCLSILNQGYDSCGVMWWNNKNPHIHLDGNKWNKCGFYVGTFFWMSFDLIKKIPRANFSNRGRDSMEILPSIIPHKYYSFDDTPLNKKIDFYNTSYSTKNYIVNYDQNL